MGHPFAIGFEKRDFFIAKKGERKVYAESLRNLRDLLSLRLTNSTTCYTKSLLSKELRGKKKDQLIPLKVVNESTLKKRTFRPIPGTKPLSLVIPCTTPTLKKNFI